MGHSQRFLANQKVRHAIVGAENLLNTTSGDDDYHNTVMTMMIMIIMMTTIMVPTTMTAIMKNLKNCAEQWIEYDIQYILLKCPLEKGTYNYYP